MNTGRPWRTPRRNRDRLSYAQVATLHPPGPSPYPAGLSGRRMSLGSGGSGSGSGSSSSSVERGEELTPIRRNSSINNNNNNNNSQNRSRCSLPSSPELLPHSEVDLPLPLAKFPVQCPECFEQYEIDKEEALPTCPKCSYICCLRCRGPYHGNTMCFVRTNYVSETEDEDDFEDATLPLSSSQIPMEDVNLDNGPCPSGGSAARPYESEFYSKLSYEDEIGKEEISAAFFKDDIEQEPDWPWNDLSEDYLPLPNNPLSQDYENYKSLLPRSWVEDELLERAILALMKTTGYLKTKFLESFVLRFAAKKDISDGVLARIIKEKTLLSATRTLALINTDLKGHGSHWMLAWISVRNPQIVLFDSSIVHSAAYYQPTFYLLLRILHIAHALEGLPFDPERYRLRVSLDAVQQDNSFDCGPLAVCNAYATMVKGAMRARPKTDQVRRWIFNVLKDDEKEKKATAKEAHTQKKGEAQKKSRRKTSQIIKIDEIQTPIPPFKPRNLRVWLRSLTDYE